MRFDWDENKAAENLTNHGVSFEEAAEAFDDPNAVEVFDADHPVDEYRYRITGLSSRRLVTVVFTERGLDFIRIISAWKATQKEQERYERGES